MDTAHPPEYEVPNPARAAASVEVTEHISSQPQSSSREAIGCLLLLLVAFVVSCVFRSSWATKVQSFRFINDEMLYWNMAHSLWQQGRLLYHGVPITFVNILYPLVLAPLTAIVDVAEAFYATKILGSILISTAAFPAYLIGKRLLHGHRGGLLVAIAALCAPEMIFSALMLTEVVFFPVSLWFCYAVVCYLDIDPALHRKRCIHLASMALFALVLFLSKTSSIFLPFSFGLLLIVETWLDRDWKWEGLWRIGIYGGMFVLFYFIYHISFIIANGLQVGTTNELGTLVQYFNSFDQIPYTILCVLLYLMVFAVSVLFFPAILPLIHYQDFPPERKKLILYTLIAAIIGSLIIVLTISLKEDYPDYQPRIHLRYLFPIFFLMLPMACDALLHFSAEGKGKALAISLAVLLFPYLYINTSARNLILYDAPSRSLVRFMQSTSLDDFNTYMLLRLGVVLAFLIFAWLRSLNKRPVMLTALLCCSYFGFGIASSGEMYNYAVPDLTSYQQQLVREATLVGNYLQKHEGNVLLLCHEPRGDAMLEPYLGRPYYLLWEGESEWHDYLWSTGREAQLALRPVPVHVQYSTYAMRPHLPTVDYVLLSGTQAQTTLDPDSLLRIELDTSVYKLYRVLNPTRLTPQSTLSGPVANEPFASSHRLRWRWSEDELPADRELLLELDCSLKEAPENDPWTLCIELGANFEQRIDLPLTALRSRPQQLIRVPDGALFYDIKLTVLDASGEVQPMRVHSYSLRRLKPRA